MKNVSITVEEPVLEWARIEAARRNSSVSCMDGGIPAEKMRQEDVYALTIDLFQLLPDPIRS